MADGPVALVFEGGIAQALATLAASPVATTVAALSEKERAALWEAGRRRPSQRSSVCEPQFGVAAQNLGPYAYARDLSESQPVKETTSVGPRTPGPQGLG